MLETKYDEIFEFWIPGVCLSGKLVGITKIVLGRLCCRVKSDICTMYLLLGIILNGLLFIEQYYIHFTIIFFFLGISLLGFIGNILSAVILSR